MRILLAIVFATSWLAVASANSSSAVSLDPEPSRHASFSSLPVAADWEGIVHDGRAMHSVTLIPKDGTDRASDMVIIYGGVDSLGVCLDALPSLTIIELGVAGATKDVYRLHSSDVLPPPLAGHTATYIPSIDSLVVIGGVTIVQGKRGSSHSVWSNAVWVLDIKKLQWRKIETDGSLQPRNGHVALLRDNRIFVFGGQSDDGVVESSVSYIDITDYQSSRDKPLSWVEVDVVGKTPAPRHGHSAALLNGNYWTMFGGNVPSSGGTSNSLIVLDLGNNAWVTPKGNKAPQPVEGSTAVTIPGDLLTGDSMLVLGGCLFPNGPCEFTPNMVQLLGSGEDLQYEWSALAVDDGGSLAGRDGHASILLPQESPDFTSIFTFGGCDVFAGGNGSPSHTVKCFNAPLVLRISNALDAEIKCSVDCGVNGRCVAGACECLPGFMGPTCDEHDTVIREITLCPGSCSFHGVCESSGLCACDFGWSGPTCACQSDCSGHGKCTASGCFCAEGFFGDDCKVEEMKATPQACPNMCNHHGRCFNKECICDDGFRGIACEVAVDADGNPVVAEVVDNSPEGDGEAATVEVDLCGTKDCSGHGICDKSTGFCSCIARSYRAYYGDNCSLLAPYSHSVKAEETVTSPKGELVVPLPGSDVQYVTVEVHENGAPLQVRAAMPDPHTVLLVAAVSGSADSFNNSLVTLPVTIYDDVAYVRRPDTVVQDFGTTVVSKGDDQILAVGLSFFAGDIISIGDNDPDHSEVRKITELITVPGRPPVRKYALDAPLRFNHTSPFIVSRLSVSPPPQFLPLVTEPPCACSVNGGICVLSDDGSERLCVCNKGWFGPECDKLGCPDDCSGPSHGQCVKDYLGIGSEEISCVCERGWGGRGCDIQIGCGDLGKLCENEGKCIDDPARPGKKMCECSQRWMGEFCQTESCPNECSFPKGKCEVIKDTKDKECVCAPGNKGPDCSVIDTCPGNCGDHGKCVGDAFGETCHCDEGWEGTGCTIEMVCKVPDCNKHGHCVKGVCKCDEAWLGEFCDSPLPCINDCNGHGECIDGQCQCFTGYLAADCSIGTENCPNDCSNAGTCLNGECLCDPGHEGADCSLELTCQMNCYNNGICSYGKCLCFPGWSGPSCDSSDQLECKLNMAQGITSPCSSNGICVNGTCHCDAGHFGPSCERNKAAAITPVTEGPSPQCSYKGEFTNGRCHCFPSWQGADCSLPYLCGADPDDYAIDKAAAICSGNGKCFADSCYCNTGWSGANCDVSQGCPVDCAPHGYCSGGVCICDIGWEGEACEKDDEVLRECPGDCSGHGRCHSGTCLCDFDWYGDKCEKLLVCPENCSGHGYCFHKECRCDPGYEGIDCATKTPCARPTEGLFAGIDCSGHGLCSRGDCWCYDDWSGDDCSKSISYLERLRVAYYDPTCPVDDANDMVCSGHGGCYLGMCDCRIGWFGEVCNINEKQLLAQHEKEDCPHGCLNGECQIEGEYKGKCLCKPGFVGLNCNKMSRKHIEELTNACALTCGSAGSHGRCLAGQCVCEEGWARTWCDIKKTISKSGEPVADVANFMLRKASLKTREAGVPVNDEHALIAQACPNDCSQHGSCNGRSCVCEQGYGSADCSIMCPNKCSGHGTCSDSPATHDPNSWRCYCEAGWAGNDCSAGATANSGVILSGLVGVSIVTFIIGLCFIPVLKMYINKREIQKHLLIIKGSEEASSKSKDFWKPQPIRYYG